MRILVQPIISSVDLMTDSSSLMWIDFIKNALKIRDDLWFYVLLPKGYQNYDAYTLLPKTTVIQEHRYRGRFFEEVDLVDADTVFRLFNMRTGVYPIDVVVTEKTGIALLMQKLIADIRYAKEEDYVKVPVLILEDRAWARTDTHQFVDYMEFMLRAMSYSALKSVVLTNLEKDEIIDASKQYVSDAYLKKLKENVEVVHLGAPVDEVVKIADSVKKREKFTVFWGGRISGQKRVPFILEQYHKLFEFGRDIDIIITTPHVGSVKFFKILSDFEKRNKNLKIMFDVKRQDFIRLCAESHVWLSASMAEGFTVGFSEMAATGTVGIVPRRPWSEELFGKDYPLMYDASSFEQAAGMLRWVYDNYDEAKKIGQKTRERFTKQFNNMQFADMLLSRLEALVDDNRGLCRRFIVDEWTKVADTLDVILDRAKALGVKQLGLWDIASEFKKLSYGGVDFGDSALMTYPSLWDVRNYLCLKGVKELYDSEVPKFEVS